MQRLIYKYKYLYLYMRIATSHLVKFRSVWKKSPETDQGKSPKPFLLVWRYSGFVSQGPDYYLRGYRQ